MAVYVNPLTSRTDEAGARALAGRVLGSLRPGTRKLDLSAREVTLEKLKDGKSLTVQLPAGWVHYSQPGPDFVVHHHLPVVPLGQDGARAGLYLGDHPGWIYESQGHQPSGTQKTTLLGTETEWKRWGTATIVTLEAMFPLPDERVGHAFLTSSPQRLDETRQLLESLRATP